MHQGEIIICKMISGFKKTWQGAGFTCLGHFENSSIECMIFSLLVTFYVSLHQFVNKALMEIGSFHLCIAVDLSDIECICCLNRYCLS